MCSGKLDAQLILKTSACPVQLAAWALCFLVAHATVQLARNLSATLAHPKGQEAPRVAHSLLLLLAPHPASGGDFRLSFVLHGATFLSVHKSTPMKE